MRKQYKVMLLHKMEWYYFAAIIIVLFMIIWIYIRVFEKGKDYPTMSTNSSSGNSHCRRSPTDHVPVLNDVIIESVSSMNADDWEDVAAMDRMVEEKAIAKMTKGELLCYKVLKSHVQGEIRCHVRDLDELKNPKTGRNLELDFYIPSKKIAVEYHGRQHYEYVKMFHKSERDLHYQKWKDNFKINACDAAGIYLITVPYYIKDSELENFIVRYLDQAEE